MIVLILPRTLISIFVSLHSCWIGGKCWGCWDGEEQNLLLQTFIHHTQIHIICNGICKMTTFTGHPLYLLTWTLEICFNSLCDLLNPLWRKDIPETNCSLSLELLHHLYCHICHHSFHQLLTIQHKIEANYWTKTFSLEYFDYNAHFKNELCTCQA